jgi:stage V sporulation protein R
VGRHTGQTLPPSLWDVKEQIKDVARGAGLDFFETIFEILDYAQMNAVAARGGYPTRYPHWRFGMEYEQLSKSYRYGLSKIYEMVVNNDPCYAYLLEGNDEVDQKIVMAHVYAHCDFFKNNYWFSHTNRKMIDEMANHATRIRKYMERFGQDDVEAFLDIALSLENLIDYHAPFIARRRTDSTASSSPSSGQPSLPPSVTASALDEAPEAEEIPRIRAKEYLEHFVNPEEFIAEQRERRKRQAAKQQRFPEEAQRDVLQFLVDFAPLKRWQRDVLSIVREEAYYFAPQGQTKIMNEGWATYWHSTIMTTGGVLKASEIIDYADRHAGVVAMAPGRMNPYTLGLGLFRDIEERWDRGRFGREYEHCDDLAARRAWDKQLGLGRKKIYEVRRHYNDVTFIDEFFTEDFCREQRFFAFDFNQKSGRYEISSREFRAIKEKLLFQLTNFGQPFIAVVDGDMEHRGELLLRHRHEGVDLKMDYARDTLENLYRVWTRPVHILTKTDGAGRMLSFNGKEHSDRSAAYD